MTALEAVVAAPPSIRALAKVIHDVDHDDFAELFDEHGLIKKNEVSKLLHDIKGGEELNETERSQFDSAYVEYGQHLRGLNIFQTAKNIVGEGLILTSSIDSECSLAGIALGSALDSVMATHNFFMSIVSFEVPTKHREIFNIFAKNINKYLADLLTIIRVRGQHRHEAMSKQHQEDIVLFNSKLWFLVDHMKWYVDASKQTIFYDVRDHIHDISAVAVWKEFIGIHVPACTAEKFTVALQVFPEWARKPIMEALNFLNCGVVSVYSLVRLLNIWGPFLLLDRNIANDAELKLLNLAEPTELLYHRMADSEPGSYAVGISRSYGLLDVVLVTPKGTLKKIPTDHSIGAWVLKGVSQEGFETIRDACCMFPDIFSKPMGVDYGVPALQKEEHNEAFSILHRACFRNNFGYVKNLLERGGTVLVNTAVADPSITKHYTWSPLMCAVNNPNGDPADVVRILIENGAEVDVRDEAQCRPLYYCIVNNFPMTARLLLQTCPHLESSSSTVPLLVALGAHWFNPSDNDNRRTADCVPHPGVVRELLPYTRNWDLVKAAINIVEGKMLGVDYQRQDCPVDWNFAGKDIPRRTDSELEVERRCISHHTQLCRASPIEMKDTLAELRQHSFLLSCHAHISYIRRYMRSPSVVMSLGATPSATELIPCQRTPDLSVAPGAEQSFTDEAPSLISEWSTVPDDYIAKRPTPTVEQSRPDYVRNLTRTRQPSH